MRLFANSLASWRIGEASELPRPTPVEIFSAGGRGHRLGLQLLHLVNLASDTPPRKPGL